MPYKNKEDQKLYIKEYKKKKSIEKGTYGQRGKHKRKLKDPNVIKKERRLYEKEWFKLYNKNNPAKRMIISAKYRAKKNNIPFNITEEDIMIPKFCPYLNLELISCVENSANREAVMSLDRIDPAKGYTKDNIQVISQLANTMKNKATKDQLILFAKNVLILHEVVPNI